MKAKLQNIIKDSDFKEILTKGFSFLVFRLGGTIAGYLFTIFITLKFGANIYGLVALGFSIFLISSVVGKLGLDINILQFFSDDDNDKQSGIFYKSIIKSFVFSSFIALVIYYFRNELVLHVFEEPKPQLLPYLPWVLAAIPFWSVNNICNGYLRAKKKTKTFAFFNNPGRFVFALLAILILYFFTEDPLITVQAHFFGVLISALLSFLVVAFQIKTFQLKSTVNSWRFLKSALPMMLSSSILILLGWMDTIVMGIYVTDSEIGVYNVALKVAALTSFSLEAINSILAPKIAQNYWKGDEKNYKKLIAFSTKLNFFISSGVVLVIIFASQFLLGMFGDEFVTGTTILFIFCFGQIVNSFSGSVAVILQMIGKQKVFQNFVLAALIINVVATFILTPIYGGVGSAIATVSSLAFWSIGCSIYLKRKMGIISYFNPFQNFLKKQ